MSLIQSERTLAVAAAKAGMDVKISRKYRRSGRLPSQHRVEHTWRTRVLIRSPRYGASSRNTSSSIRASRPRRCSRILQRRYPGRFQDGQLRTLQRRVKIWHGLAGPAREIFFSQIHEPWESSAHPISQT